MRAFWFIAVMCGCSFSAPIPEEQPNGNADADIDVYMADAAIPDGATSCPTATPPMCVPMSNILRQCVTQGQPAVDTPCAWGCNTNGTHHCSKLVPSGGAVVTADLDPNPSLQDKTITTSGIQVAQFNTDSGAITGVRGTGQGIQNGIDFQIRNGVGIWRFNKLKMETFDGASVRIAGRNAAAIVSLTTIDVERTVVDVRGTCTASNPGPGGKAGGATETAGAAGGGAGGAGLGYNGNDSGGGGGGAYGYRGGNGGRPAGETTPQGGAMFGNLTISTLTGGGGGGGGGGPAGGVGGGGGGAIQLVANGVIKLTGVIAVYAGINAGGCGGKPGTSGDAGGGGDAGGAILIEAPSIILNIGGLSVNGGGGGGGDGGASGGNGGFGTNRATGGPGANGAGNGGAGGASGNLAGSNAPDNDNGGGGGGGVGWIRTHTLSGGVSMQNGSFTSPSFNDNGTTATRGMPTVQ